MGRGKGKYKKTPPLLGREARFGSSTVSLHAQPAFPYKEEVLEEAEEKIPLLRHVRVHFSG